MKKGYPISLPLQTNPAAKGSVAVFAVTISYSTRQLWRNRRHVEMRFKTCSQ